MTLAEITRAGINFLSKDLSKGFFLMVEGGKIDWAGHSNDAATNFREVMDMDEAIKVAENKNLHIIKFCNKNIQNIYFIRQFF